ncbi:MAG: GH116 family glycosyl hydrolase [Bacteroidota bacterium]
MICNRKYTSLLFALLVLFSLPGLSQGVKGKNARRHSFSITKDEGRGTKEEGGRVGDLILMVGREPLSPVDTELVAAMEFVGNLEGYPVSYMTFQELKKHPRQLKNTAVVWFHRPDTSKFSTEESDRKVIKLLREYLEQGGNILLTLDAFRYINQLGVESVIPAVRSKSSVDEGYGRKLGFHAFREHPLFAGLNGGSYIYKPTQDLTVRVNGFFGDTIPETGKVVAIDWDYIFFRENSKLVVEYQVGQGKVVAVGAYTHYTALNDNRLHLEAFTTNVLDYLTDKLDTQHLFHWDFSPPTVTRCPPKEQNRDILLAAIPKATHWELTSDPLAFPLHPATNSYCEAAGERMLIMGQEKGGIEEIWSHPFMALRDFESGIRFHGHSDPGYSGEATASESITWLNDLTPEIEIRPDGFIRHYQIDTNELDELVTTDPSLPCGVVHYTWDGPEKVELLIRFRTNLRLMWPYPANSISSICYGWDADYQAFIFTDKSGDLAVVVGGNKVPDHHYEKQGDGFLVDAGASYSLDSGETLDIVIVAGNDGSGEMLNQFDQAIRDPQKIFLRARQYVEDLLRERLMVTTPDTNFNAGYRWALIGTDRFFVTTPGMGSALVAGYGTTRRGWDGAQEVSGRPGYAWYFGRDGQWSGLALLDYGDFEKVKQNLEFFLKYQDLNGKIFHEATTSGVIHYDASDATPLFLVLAGNYFSHSGDTAFLKTNWKGIKDAINFCFSTDTDSDHLIENTNVGHGWVEGGKLYGSHSSFYLTGCWVAALEAAATMADGVNDPDANLYRHEVKVVKGLIDPKFWNPTERFYAYGLNRDGSQRTDPTILPAVPAYFGVTDKWSMRYLLDQYASNAFSTNWGTRIIREDSPMFKPTGYHYGSVWPLFTGWTALAEYRYGNYIQGFTHIMNNLNVYRNWGLGFVEEVLNGAEYQPSGVCPHQCWSETMVLQPVIEGMLGIDVDAPNFTLNLSPRLPSNWDSITVERIRIGNQLVDFSFVRDTTRITWKFTKSEGKDLIINFMPTLPPGTKINHIWVNGQEYPFATFTTNRFISLLVNFTISEMTAIVVDFDEGISVLPLVPCPAPGDRAEGMRIIDAQLKGDSYLIDLEGLAGTSDTLSIWSYLPLEEVIHGDIINRKGRVTKILVDFGSGDVNYRKKLVLVRY